MLPQGDVVFKHYVDQWLDIAMNDGTYEEIARPWIGDVDLTLEK
jgi:cyclohexadienyl dehydratase